MCQVHVLHALNSHGLQATDAPAHALVPEQSSTNNVTLIEEAAAAVAGATPYRVNVPVYHS